MVKIPINSGETRVYFPNPAEKSIDGVYSLKVHSDLLNKDWLFDGLEDKMDLDDYYVFDVDFTNLKDGEYEYSLMGHTGLLRIGVVPHTAASYSSDKEFIEYKG